MLSWGRVTPCAGCSDSLRSKAFGFVLCPLQPLTCGPSFILEKETLLRRKQAFPFRAEPLSASWVPPCPGIDTTATQKGMESGLGVGVCMQLVWQELPTKASGVRPPPSLKLQRDITREPRSPRRSSPRRGNKSPDGTHGHSRNSRVRLHTPKSADADATSLSPNKRCVSSWEIRPQSREISSSKVGVDSALRNMLKKGSSQHCAINPHEHDLAL